MINPPLAGDSALVVRRLPEAVDSLDDFARLVDWVFVLLILIGGQLSKRVKFLEGWRVEWRVLAFVLAGGLVIVGSSLFTSVPTTGVLVKWMVSYAVSTRLYVVLAPLGDKILGLLKKKDEQTGSEETPGTRA